ncbi:hypothetical protein HHI36_023928 [Cryptolaemus montrouzieri]|uniref:Uncharacterized protein n=1 Tax=Cryptolaemus montrouzieri TaxID=559131 RepID=A0ABD2NJD2_9CUCU
MAVLSNKAGVLDANVEEVCMKWFHEVNSDMSDDDCEEDKFLESERETNSEQEVSEDDAGKIIHMELTEEENAERSQSCGYCYRRNRFK